MFRKQRVIVQIEANLVWKVLRDPATDTWIGVCDALNMNAVGDTWAEFQECANEAMSLLFTDLFEDGELESYLRANGWHLGSPAPAPGSKPRFDIPFDSHRAASVEDLIPA